MRRFEGVQWSRRGKGALKRRAGGKIPINKFIGSETRTYYFLCNNLEINIFILGIHKCIGSETLNAYGIPVSFTLKPAPCSPASWSKM
jgi:hypothetical protein